MSDRNATSNTKAPANLAIIVPTYNEKENVPLLVQRISASLNSYPYRNYLCG